MNVQSKSEPSVWYLECENLTWFVDHSRSTVYEVVLKQSNIG